MSRKRIFGACLGAGLLLIFLTAVSFRVGSAPLDWTQFLMGLLRREGYETFTTILYALRLPRILACLLTGIGLSSAGILLQSVTENPMASPNIIGVNSGAGLGLVLALLLFPSGAVWLPAAAFAGALAAAFLLLGLAGKKDLSGLTVILAGIACNALLNAGISLLCQLENDLIPSYAAFSAGSFAGITADRLPLPAAGILISFAVSLFLSRRVDLLCLGDSCAGALGVRVRGLRAVCVVLAAAAAACVVSFAGLIGFVGLIVPHIGRKIVGARTGPLLLFSALAGGCLVLAADVAGRVLFSPSELPAGILLAFLGAPFFWVLLLRKRGGLL